MKYKRVDKVTLNEDTISLDKLKNLLRDNYKSVTLAIDDINAGKILQTLYAYYMRKDKKLY